VPQRREGAGADTTELEAEQACSSELHHEARSQSTLQRHYARDELNDVIDESSFATDKNEFCRSVSDSLTRDLITWYIASGTAHRRSDDETL